MGGHHARLFAIRGSIFAKRLGGGWIFRPFLQLKVVFAGLKFLFTTKAVFLSLFRRPARIFTVFDVMHSKPRIGVQDGKIEISQTLSQQRPLETILENTRISSFWFKFSELIIFLMFYLWPASKPPKNVLHLLPW